MVNRTIAGRRLPVVVGIIAALMAVLLPAVAAAQAEKNLVKNGDAETGDLANWSNMGKVVSHDVHGGANCFEVDFNSNVKSKELIPIDPGKTYALSGWFKSTGEAESKVYFGCIPYCAEMKRISSVHVYCYGGTETTLVEACKKGDTVVKIANGSKWCVNRNAVIAFKVDNSGQYADLPNRNITPHGITKVVDNGKYWEVHMRAPCTVAYPAGTKVREQRYGSSYMYSASRGKKAPMAWTCFSGKISGEALVGDSQKQWWRGTRYARIVILANYGQKGDYCLLIDDVSMVEAK